MSCLPIKVRDFIRTTIPLFEQSLAKIFAGLGKPDQKETRRNSPQAQPRNHQLATV